jgi:Condensation domain/Phosphopantetheine attachment site
LFQVMFGFAELTPSQHDDRVPSFIVEDPDTSIAEFDLFLNMTRGKSGGFEGELRYNTDLFDDGTIEDLVGYYLKVTAELAGAPDTPWTQLSRLRPGAIALASTFVTEALSPVLRGLSRYAGLLGGLMAPFHGRITEYLSDPNGMFARNEHGVNVILLRWEDFVREQGIATEDPATAATLLDETFDEFRAAIGQYRADCAAPLAVIVCPPSLAWSTRAWAVAFAVLSRRLAESCEQLPDVLAASASAGDALATDDESGWPDAIPYATDGFFASLGTSIAGHLLALLAQASAAAPADGPHALWRGRLTRAAAGPGDLTSVLARLLGNNIHGPAPEAAAEPFVEPATDTERRLAALWRETLAIERIGLNDNFFGLGGHSFLAIEMLRRIGAEFGQAVMPYDLFSRPTIGHLAQVLDSAPLDTVPKRGPVPVPRNVPLPVSSTQRRMRAAARLREPDARDNLAFAARLEGLLDEFALRTALSTLLARHEILRATISDEDGQPTLRMHPADGPWADAVFPPVAHLRPARDQRAETDRLVREVATEPFDLEAGPLIRVRLFSFGPREHCLVIVMHHAVSDHESWTIFLDELSIVYAAAREGRQPALPALCLQFADYACWQEAWLASPGAADGARRWRDLLEPVPARSVLPTDIQHSASGSHGKDRVTLRINPELAARLRSAARDLEVPLFSVLLAGYGLLVRHHTAQKYFVVGMPVANREYAGLAGAMGPFADLLPIRLAPHADLAVTDLVHATHEAILASRRLMGLPFGEILSASRPRQVTGRHPLFQTVVNLVEDEGPPVFAGLDLTELPQPPRDAGFDLFFDFRPDGDGLFSTLEFTCDLYSRDSAQALLKELVTTLDALTGPPHLVPDRSHCIEYEATDERS